MKSQLKEHFVTFKNSIEGIPLPVKFTFPFYYEPHTLSVMAAQELQEYLNHQNDWQHNFGLNETDEGLVIGKMFGVLVVKDAEGNLGYLAAFSGKLAESNHHHSFVPPVFDMLSEDSFFHIESEVLNVINSTIEKLESDDQYIRLKKLLETQSLLAKEEIAIKKKEIKLKKKERQQIRTSSLSKMDATSYEILLKELIKESLQNQFYLKALTENWQEKIKTIEKELFPFVNSIVQLKESRKEKSNALQKKLFEQYSFLNQKGKEKNLNEIFNQDLGIVPPAGSGECAAPKLLHYAFLHQYEPIAMAEFWWGASPKSEVRKHGQFYPACRGKCEPILKHMLEGIQMDENPMEKNFAKDKVIEILYEDEYFLAINKPAELLSVPGINIQDSVYNRMQIKFPNATGPLIVHRLDMNTSGLMLVAKSKEVHKNLQGQFIKRKVQKTYVAILEGLLTSSSGLIDLPLRVDLDDRPRQLVCYEHGKPAQTRWETIEVNEKLKRTKIRFFPITGRTHQLRVHAAHPLGLNTPILGDDLYGNKNERLHLHAQKIVFKHPVTLETMVLEAKAEF